MEIGKSLSSGKKAQTGVKVAVRRDGQGNIRQIIQFWIATTCSAILELINETSF